MKTTQLFRLISIINSLFIIPACSAQNPSQSLIEDIFEDLSVNNSVDNAVNEPNWENELEELSVRLHEPVDLNRATRQQLEQFPFLSDIQIEHLLAYIYVHGQMETLYELQLIEDMDRQTIQYLLPFVCIKAINNESSFRWKTMLKSAMKYGKNEVLTRIDIPFTSEEVMNIPIWDLLFITLLSMLSVIVTSSMQVSLRRRMPENLSLLCTIVKGMIIILLSLTQRLWAVKNIGCW